MNVSEITIGRDELKRNLKISIKNYGSKELVIVHYGTESSVPKSVSRNHVKIEVSNKGELFLTNMNINNVTYVNGLCVVNKRIVHKDRIELGENRYCLSWNEVLDKFLPKFADIRPLEKVWNKYYGESQKIGIRVGEKNALRYSTMFISSVSGFFSAFFYDKGSAYLTIICGLICIISFYFLVDGWFQAKKVPLQQEALKKKAQDQYICPLCKCELPFQEYRSLKNIKRCPNPDCNAYYIS